MNKLYKSLIKIAENGSGPNGAVKIGDPNSKMADRLSEVDISPYIFEIDSIKYMNDFTITGDPNAIVDLSDKNVGFISLIYDKDVVTYDDLVNFIYAITKNEKLKSNLTYIKNNIGDIPELNEKVGASIGDGGKLLEEEMPGLQGDISKDYYLADLVIRLDEVRFELTGLRLIDGTPLTPNETKNEGQHTKIIDYLITSYNDFKYKITNISNLDPNDFSGVSLKEKVSDHLLEILDEKLPPENITDISVEGLKDTEVLKNDSAHTKIIKNYQNSLIGLSKATGDLVEDIEETSDIAEEGDFSTVDVSPTAEPSFESDTTDVEVNKALYYYATSTKKFNNIAKTSIGGLADYSNLFKVLLQEDNKKYHKCQSIEAKFFDTAESSSSDYNLTGNYEITYIFANGIEKTLEFLYSAKDIKFAEESGSFSISDSNFIINQKAKKAALKAAKRLHLDTIFKGISSLPSLSGTNVSMDPRLISPLKKVKSKNGLSVLDPNSSYLHSNTNVFYLISKLRDSKKLTMDMNSGGFTQARGIPIPLRGSNLEIVTKNISYKNNLKERPLDSNEINEAAKRGYAYIDSEDQNHYKNKEVAALNFFKEDQQTLASIKLSINSLVSKIYAKAALNLNEKYATGTNQDMTASLNFSDPISNEALASVAEEIFKNHIDDVQGIYTEALEEIGVENSSKYVSNMSSTLQSGLFNIANSYAAPSNYNSVARKALKDLSGYQYTPDTNEASDFIIKDSKWNNNTNIRDISNKKKFKSRVSKLLLSHFHKVASGQSDSLVSSTSTDNLFSGNTSSATNGMASVVEFLGSNNPYEINIKIEAEIKASAKDIGIYYDIPNNDEVKALFKGLFNNGIKEFHGFKIHEYGDTFKLEKTLDGTYTKSAQKELIFSSFVKETNGQSVSYGKLANFTDTNGSQVFNLDKAPGALGYFMNIREGLNETVNIDSQANGNILGVQKRTNLWKNKILPLAKEAGSFNVTFDPKAINYTLEFGFKGRTFDVNMKMMPVEGSGSTMVLDSAMGISGYSDLFKAIRDGSLDKIQETFLNPETNSFVHGNKKATGSLSPEQFFEAVNESSKSFIPTAPQTQTYNKTIVLRLDNAGLASYSGLTDQKFVFPEAILTGDNLIYHKESKLVAHNSNPNEASSITYSNKQIALSANPNSPNFRDVSFGSSQVNANASAGIKEKSLYEIYEAGKKKSNFYECLDSNTKDILANIDDEGYNLTNAQTFEESTRNLVLAKASFDNHYNVVLEKLKKGDLDEVESNFYKKLKKSMEDNLDFRLSDAKKFRDTTVAYFSESRLSFTSDEVKRVMDLDAILSDINESNNLSILVKRYFPSIDDSKIHMKPATNIAASSPIEVLYDENYISRFNGQQIRGDENFRAIQHALNQASGDNFSNIYKNFSKILKSLSTSDLDSVNVSNYTDANVASGGFLKIDLNSFSFEEKDSVVRQLISLKNDSFKVYAMEYIGIDESEDLTEAKLKSNIPKIIFALEKELLEDSPKGSIYTADQIDAMRMRSNLVVPEELFSLDAKIFSNADEFYAYMKENAEFGKYIEVNSSRIDYLLNEAIIAYSSSIEAEAESASKFLSPADFSITFASKGGETKQYFKKDNLEDAKNALAEIDSEIRTLESNRGLTDRKDPNRSKLAQDVNSLRNLKEQIGSAIQAYEKEVAKSRSESLKEIRKADEHIAHLKIALGDAGLIFEKNIFEEIIGIDVNDLAEKGIDSKFILKLSESEGEFAAKLFLSLNSKYSYVIRNVISDPSISAEIYRNLQRSIESSSELNLNLIESGYGKNVAGDITRDIELSNTSFLDESGELTTYSKKQFGQYNNFAASLFSNRNDLFSEILSDDSYLLYNKADVGLQDIKFELIRYDGDEIKISAKIGFYVYANGKTDVTISGVSYEEIEIIKGKSFSIKTGSAHIELEIPNDLNGSFFVKTKDVSLALENYFFTGDNYLKAISNSDKARFEILSKLVKDNKIRFEVNVEKNQLKSAAYKILYFYEDNLIFSSIYSEEKIVQFAGNPNSINNNLERIILNNFLGTTGLEGSSERIKRFRETVSKYNSSSSILRALQTSEINSGTRILTNIYSSGLQSTEAALNSIDRVGIEAVDFIGKFHTFFEAESSTAKSLIFDISKYNSDEASFIRQKYSDFKTAVEYYNAVCFDNPIAAQQVLDKAKSKITGTPEEVSRVLYYLGFNIAKYSSNALGPMSSNMSAFQLNNLKKYFDLFSKINSTKSDFFTVDDFNNNIFKPSSIEPGMLQLTRCSDGEHLSIRTVDDFINFIHSEAEFFLERGNVQLYQQLIDELVRSVSISSIEVGLGALRSFAGLNLNSGVVSDLVRFMRRSFGSMFPDSHIGSEIGKDIEVLQKALNEIETVYGGLGELEIKLAETAGNVEKMKLEIDLLKKDIELIIETINTNYSDSNYKIGRGERTLERVKGRLKTEKAKVFLEKCIGEEVGFFKKRLLNLKSFLSTFISLCNPLNSIEFMLTAYLYRCFKNGGFKGGFKQLALDIIRRPLSIISHLTEAISYINPASLLENSIRYSTSLSHTNIANMRMRAIGANKNLNLIDDLNKTSKGVRGTRGRLNMRSQRSRFGDAKSLFKLLSKGVQNSIFAFTTAAVVGIGEAAAAAITLVVLKGVYDNSTGDFPELGIIAPSIYAKAVHKNLLEMKNSSLRDSYMEGSDRAKSILPGEEINYIDQNSGGSLYTQILLCSTNNDAQSYISKLKNNFNIIVNACEKIVSEQNSSDVNKLTMQDIDENLNIGIVDQLHIEYKRAFDVFDIIKNGLYPVVAEFVTGELGDDEGAMVRLSETQQPIAFVLESDKSFEYQGVEYRVNHINGLIEKDGILFGNQDGKDSNSNLKFSYSEVSKEMFFTNVVETVMETLSSVLATLYIIPLSNPSIIIAPAIKVILQKANVVNSVYRPNKYAFEGMQDMVSQELNLILDQFKSLNIVHILKHDANFFSNYMHDVYEEHVEEF